MLVLIANLRMLRKFAQKQTIALIAHRLKESCTLSWCEFEPILGMMELVQHVLTLSKSPQRNRMWRDFFNLLRKFDRKKVLNRDVSPAWLVTVNIGTSSPIKSIINILGICRMTNKIQFKRIKTRTITLV